MAPRRNVLDAVPPPLNERPGMESEHVPERPHRRFS